MSDLTSLLTESGASLGGWAYPLVGALAYLETAALVGLFVPGELAVVAAGALAATGAIDLTWTIAVVWAAAVAGDSTAFAVGRRLGAGGVGERLERRRPAEAARARSIIERHGVAAIVAGRFVGVLRAFAPLLAGSAGMPTRRFLAADVVGAGLWASCFALLGHTFWGQPRSGAGRAPRSPAGRRRSGRGGARLPTRPAPRPALGGANQPACQTRSPGRPRWLKSQTAIRSSTTRGFSSW